MLDLFHIAKPQGCDIQTFYGDGAVSTVVKQSWVKPRGVSHVYILMIGAGGTGDGGTTGGGSGAVTVWYGAAQNVPDILFPIPGRGNAEDTRLGYRGTSGTIIALLTASSASSSGGGAAMTANQFAASGFFRSVAGQAGSSGAQSPSSTTFLSGGGSSGGVTANYGYSVDSSSGYFITQPIIVGVGGSAAGSGGIGCGGGNNNGVAGPGMVLIASW